MRPEDPTTSTPTVATAQPTTALPATPTVPELELVIDALKSTLASVTSQVEDGVRDTHRLTEENAQLQQHNQIVAQEKSQLETSHGLALDQLHTLTQSNLQLQADFHQLSEAHRNLLLEHQTDQETVIRLTGEIADFGQRLLLIETENAALVAEKLGAAARATELEKSWARTRDDLEAVRKELASLKKKHQAECARAIDQVAELQRQLEGKAREAESWQSVMELKQGEVKRLMGEVEVARTAVERHSMCEQELSRQKMKIEDLEVKVEHIATAEK